MEVNKWVLFLFLHPILFQGLCQFQTNVYSHSEELLRWNIVMESFTHALIIFMYTQFIFRSCTIWNQPSDSS